MAEESAREDAARRSMAVTPTPTLRSTSPPDLLKAQRTCEEMDRSRVEKLVAQLAARDEKIKKLLVERRQVIEKRQAQNSIRYSMLMLRIARVWSYDTYPVCSSILKMRGRDTTKKKKGSPSCSFSSC